VKIVDRVESRIAVLAHAAIEFTCAGYSTPSRSNTTEKAADYEGGLLRSRYSVSASPGNKSSVTKKQVTRSDWR